MKRPSLRNPRFFALGLLALAPTAHAGEYHVTDLGTLGGGYSEAYGVNASGQATGRSSVASTSPDHAFLYSDGVLHDLGTLGGSNSYGNAIDPSGRLVGMSNTRDGQLHAFLYENGAMRDLGTLGGNFNFGDAINASGRVAGASYIAGDSTFHAFLSATNGGELQDLGTLPGGGSSDALGVNDSGEVTGESYVGTGGFHAFLYAGRSMKDLGTLGGNSLGNAINASGLVAGFSDDGVQGNSHAVLFSGGAVQDLGVLPGGDGSEALALDSAGRVVGESDVLSAYFPYYHAFLYEGGAMLDLNSMLDASGVGWTLQAATGIDDSGLIVGYGLHGDEVHAYLLAPVPEPASLLALGVGALGLLRRRKRA